MVTLEQIKELRDKTGLGMMSCKNALLETDGNIEKAIEILRKKGELVAEKRSSNKTSQGIIHSYIHAGSQIGVLIEINCETDFVARNEEIKKFAYDICMHIAAMNPACVLPEEMDKNFIEKEVAIFKEQMANQNKPAAVIDKIIEGKIAKLASDNSLIEQKFVKNDKITVNDYLKEIIAKMGENIKIKKFVRFEIGS